MYRLYKEEGFVLKEMQTEQKWKTMKHRGERLHAAGPDDGWRIDFVTGPIPTTKPQKMPRRVSSSMLLPGASSAKNSRLLIACGRHTSFLRPSNVRYARDPVFLLTVHAIAASLLRIGEFIMILPECWI
jgi:hypothetical protein